ncbi:MAG: glycoside hydrolase 100 family protein, partial [Cyanobacteriota bacterium]|nr:glycoside hydrolase 100 family protein [Cyanobacteriota bacterium]
MEENALEIEAMRILVESLISYKGSLVGTPAAYTAKKNRKENERAKVSKDMLNYDQVFIRDFIPVALLFLIKGDFEITINGKLELIKCKEIVKNFLEVTLELHQQERSSTFLNTGRVLMPASFKIIKKQGKEKLEPDFGQHAIARVTPVDSSLWWIILLRAYWKATGKTALVHRIDFQEGIRLILELCFSDRFDREPTILVPDGAC